MTTKLQLSDLVIEVERKAIKHLHLSVYPPDGRVRIAAPERMTLESIRLFAIGKLPWIRRQRSKMKAQRREPAREYTERESHYVFGRRYLLEFVEREAAPSVELKRLKLQVHVRAASDESRRREIIDDWYRTVLRTQVDILLGKWQPIVKAKANRVFLQRMRTKWGSCNSSSKHIRLNTELAKKPLECLEYVLVHELVHLRYPTHGARFVAKMDEVMPQWRDMREVLNQLELPAF